MAKAKSANSDKQPQVYKQNELDLMIELVSAGMWKSTNLSKTLNVDMNTIAEWKKRVEVQKAYRETVLKFIRKRQDPEKVLQELDIDSEQDSPLIQNNYYNLSDERLDEVIAAKARKIGITEPAPGERTQTETTSS